MHRKSKKQKNRRKFSMYESLDHERIAKLCKCLKIIEQGKEPKKEDLGIEDKEEFGIIGEIIKDFHLATNISIQRGGQGNKVLIVFMNHSEVTDIGRDFLERFSQQ
jgi:hypothetical protein